MQSLLSFGMLLLLFSISCRVVSSFHLTPTLRSNNQVRNKRTVGHPFSYLGSTSDDSWGEGGEEEEDNDESDDFEILFEDEETNLDVMEKAWRYAKKPLLSIGAKGATVAHGNSLRQLLDSHTIVKVKVNTSKFGKWRKFLISLAPQLTYYIDLME